MSLIPQMMSIRSGCAIPAFFLSTCRLLLALVYLVGPARADQSMSFVWVADTRGNANNDIIDTTVLTPIVNSIVALTPAPSVVIFGGDAAYRGGTDWLTKFQQVFTDRLTAAGIPTAFAIGNHELYTKDTSPLEQYALQRQQDFQSMFNSNWVQNGPAGYTNLAFSFQIGNSLFIVADSYYAPADGSTPVYKVDKAQRDWITRRLQNDTASHIFVLTHVPAFSPWQPSPNQDMADFWQTITTAGSATNTNASISFAGHEHLYYRTLHDGTYQVLAGSGGAPLGCDTPPCPPLGPVYPGDVFALSYNYAVVSIDGRYVTVSVFDQANHTLDAFQFFDNSGVQNSAINNAAPIVGPQPAGILAGSGNIINNSAAISNVATGIDAVSNNTITNSGSITPSSGGNGIHVYDNNTITNTVAGSITGNSTDLWGIRVNTGNTVVNHGTVAVSGTNSIAFLAQGDSNTFTNNGTLSASGTDSYAAKFLGTGNALVNSGTISGNVWFDAGNNAFTNSGTFDGSGGLYKVNSGTLTLRGPTSYTGGTYLNGGVINVTQDASLGAMSGGLFFGGGTLQLSADMTSARNATLNSGGGTFDTNGNALTLSGVISGPGSLSKVGDGTLTLTGVNTYSGATTVNTGTLLVNGSAAYSAATVNAGGTLAGVGTIGPVTVTTGGLFGPGSGAPGSSMSVAGNLVFQPGGVYLVHLNPTSSLANVSGSATLTGANVVAVFAPSSYLTKQYTILHTTGGFGGTAFGGFGSNIPSGFLAGLSYTSIDALLNLTANLGGGTSLLGGGLPGNQQRVATALNAYFNAGGGLPPNFVNLYGLSGTNLASALAALSGEGTSAAQQAVFNSRGQFFDAALSQAALLLDSGPTQYALAAAAPVAIPTLTGWRVWAAGFGNAGNLDGLATNPGSAKATFTNGGGSAGIDYRVNPNILVGFTAGGADASFDVSDRYTHGSASGVNLGLYGMAMLGSGVYVQGVLSYGYYNNDIHRDPVGENIGPTENARGSFGSNLFGGRFEAGWKNTFGQVNLTPFASIQFDALSQNAYSESTVVNGTTMPGIMGLHYSSHRVTSVPLSLGLQVDGSFPVGDGMTITPSARISWVHEFGSTRAISAAFLVAPDFAFGVRGAAAAEDAARMDAGLSVRFSPQFVLYGNFVGVFSGAGTTAGGLGGLKYTF
jgi:outer membrane autotransporter protein